jgi:hypothetical protein
MMKKLLFESTSKFKENSLAFPALILIGLGELSCSSTSQSAEAEKEQVAKALKKSSTVTAADRDKYVPTNVTNKQTPANQN